MNDTLKAAGRIGAELGAAKAECERLRGLLEEAADDIRDSFKFSDLSHADLELLARIDAALSQQADPAETTEAYTAVDMATAAAQGFRDGKAAVEPAPAQDEREVDLDFAAYADQCSITPNDPVTLRRAQANAYMASMKLLGLDEHEYLPDAIRAIQSNYAAAVKGRADFRAALREARAARHAQTEQQPIAVPHDFQPLETIRWWINAYTNPENGPSYQGHGMLVQMLCEYEALRIMLNAQAKGEQPAAYPHEAMDAIALSRYRVGASSPGTLHRYAVRAGDGEQELYRGSKSDCEHVARKLVGAFLDGGLTAFGLYAAPIAQTAPQGKFRMGDLVKKSTGSEWEGHICGTYSTELTPEGYAVESSAHRNSVQIYPATALEAVE